MPAPEATPHITLSALKERGWSDGLIRRLLAEPDRLTVNPHYRSGPPVKLFVLQRVMAAEQHEDFQRHQARRRRLVDAARQNAASQRERLLAAIEALTVSVTPMDWDMLMVLSLRHWDARNGGEGQDADDATRRRWAVNYARHHLTRYDAELETVAARIGAEDARRRIRRKVYTAIAAQWPALADECDRQMGTRGGWSC